VECQAGQVRTEDLRGRSSVRATMAVWTCSPAETADLAETPSRWVLGKSSCVQVAAGRHGYSYQRCSSP
jgi:hypothetical protein